MKPSDIYPVVNTTTVNLPYVDSSDDSCAWDRVFSNAEDNYGLTEIGAFENFSRVMNVIDRKTVWYTTEGEGLYNALLETCPFVIFREETESMQGNYKVFLWILDPDCHV